MKIMERRNNYKENLEKRVAAEHGATQGKLDLAKRAKQLNLDAIHDTVHGLAKAFYMTRHSCFLMSRQVIKSRQNKLAKCILIIIRDQPIHQPGQSCFSGARLPTQKDDLAVRDD